MTFENIFENVFERNQLNAYITDRNMELFQKLMDLMLETNRHMNITAITEVEKIIPLHFADCVKIAEKIPENATVADIGCGGGFPILPLAIVRPDLRLVGIDSTEKKVRYVSETARKLDLNVNALTGRAEDLAKEPDKRQSFDVVVSRAVARLNMLNELCMPFVKMGGQFIAMKGAAGLEEYAEAKNGIQKLGGVLQEIDEYELHTCNQPEKRVTIIIRQNLIIPETYPRAFGSIKKKPL